MFILITGKDPWGEPTGGQTTFAKHLIKSFKEDIAVSSLCDDPGIPIGQWVERIHEGQKIKFLSRGSITTSPNKKDLIPLRIKIKINLERHMRSIRLNDCKNILIDAPEILFVAKKYKWDSVCYSFAGVNNPVSNSRYPALRFLGAFFEAYMMHCLKKINPAVMIAAADDNAISEMVARVNGGIDKSKIFKMPTRFDGDVFFPQDTISCRATLKLPKEKLIITSVGRLCWIKGWDLQISALKILKEEIPNILMIFVGDGEDRLALERAVIENNLSENILITGFVDQNKVAQYINSADVCTVASYREGWSVAMCEILACGAPLVSTEVSGASTLIVPGENGFISRNRDPKEFAMLIRNAIALGNKNKKSLRVAQDYKIDTLKKDMILAWPILK